MNVGVHSNRLMSASETVRKLQVPIRVYVLATPSSTVSEEPASNENRHIGRFSDYIAQFPTIPMK